MVRLLEASAIRVACVPAVWKWVFHHVPPLVKLWSNHSKQPGSCWIHIIFVYLALSAAKQLSRSCILNHVNKFHEKWLRIYVIMTFKPHSHCLALSQVNNLTQYMQNSLASTKSDRQSKTKHWHQWGSPLQLSGPAPDFHTVERECASIVCLTFHKICV